MPEMLQPDPNKGPMTSGERWSYAILVGLIFCLFAADIYSDYVPEKLSVFLFLAFWMLMLPIHEAGHALMAHFLGWEVPQVVIGFGRTMGEFRVGETQVTVRMIPLEGFARLRPRTAVSLRRNAMLTTLAGMGIEFLILIVVVLIVGPQRILISSTEIPIIAAQTLGVVVLLAALINLTPHAAHTDRGPMPNDGLLFIQFGFAKYDDLLHAFGFDSPKTSPSNDPAGKSDTGAVSK